MTNKPLADKWASRDFPILVEVTRRIDQGQQGVLESDIAQSLDMPADEVQRGVAALERRKLVTTNRSVQFVWVEDVAGRAYLLTGLHPDADDATERLASLLRQAADQTNDPEEKSRLQKAASALGNLVGEVGAGVMTAFVSSYLPGQ